MIYADLYKRDFSALILPETFSLQVGAFSDSAIGGPDLATLKVSSTERDIWQVIDWLRLPVTINDTNLGELWWGYVSDIQLKMGNITFGISLDTMFNSIGVSYMQGGINYTSSDLTDSTSVAKYGTKQLMQKLSGGTTDTVANEQIRALSQLKNPTRSLSVSNHPGGFEAVLTCRGWYKTLEWQRYVNIYGREAFIDDSDFAWVAFGWGNGTGTPRIQNVAQSFKLSDGVSWHTDKIRVKVAKHLAPEELTLYLCADSAGAPGAVLDGGFAYDLIDTTLPNTGIGEFSSFGWVQSDFGPLVELQPATTYWLKLGKNGANDPFVQYYWLANRNVAYTLGSGKSYYNGAWVVPSQPCDFLFEITGTWTTDRQLEYILDQAQFITSSTISGDAYGQSSPARTGDNYLRHELEELMNVGTTDNRRFLVKVDSGRGATVYPEPVTTDISYYLLPTGELLDSYQKPISWALVKAGKWIKLKNVIPVGLQIPDIDSPDLILIERVEFDPATESVTVESRDLQSPWTIGMV